LATTDSVTAFPGATVKSVVVPGVTTSVVSTLGPVPVPLPPHPVPVPATISRVAMLDESARMIRLLEWYIPVYVL
jgi:hypothetical protein